MADIDASHHPQSSPNFTAPSSGPLNSHPMNIVRSSNVNASAPQQWTFQTPNGTLVSPSSPPRRKSSKRPMSASSGEWFSGAALTGKKPATPLPTADVLSASNADKPSHHRKLLSHHELMPSVVDNSATAGASPPDTTSPSKPSTASPPPPDIVKGFGDDFIHGRQPSWSAEKEKILLGPFDYLYGHPGKDVRTELIAAFNSWLKVPEESLKVVTSVVGMLHTASLLVDDVEDSSQLRRGIPVAHSLFGIPQTINSANYIYFLALQALNTLPNAAAALPIYTEELLNLHRGQGMDLFWRDTLTCPSETDYLEMVSNKTGGLFRLAIKLMQAESKATTSSGEPINCIPLIQAISLYFQILDDLLNLQSPTYTARKGLCEDLTEGKFSFPVIHAIRADPSNLELKNILRMKTSNDDVKRYAVAYMERTGSFHYTRTVLAELEKKAVALLAEIERQVGGDDGKRGAEQIKAILGKLKAL